MGKLFFVNLCSLVAKIGNIDVGGVVEFYVSPRWMARFDVGDTIIRYGEIRFPGLPPSFTAPSVTRHNL